MAKQIIGHISPQELRDFPDQVCFKINQLIDKVNELERNK